jgi:hypothetical protein
VEPRDIRSVALRDHLEVLRRMSGPERLEFASELMAFAHELTLAEMRARLPGASPEEVEAEHDRLALGRDLAERVLAHRSRVRGGSRAPS